jgi:uncharacterized protein YqeY
MSSTKLEEKLLADLQDAMRSGDAVRRDILRLVRADLKNEELARGAPLDEGMVLEVLSRRIKKARESIEEFAKGHRQDLIEREEAQLKSLLPYLPEPMTAQEVRELAKRVIQEVNARGPGDKGKVMSKLMPQVKGRADGKLASDVVSELLSR